MTVRALRAAEALGHPYKQGTVVYSCNPALRVGAEESGSRELTAQPLSSPSEKQWRKTPNITSGLHTYTQVSNTPCLSTPTVAYITEREKG